MTAKSFVRAFLIGGLFACSGDPSTAPVDNPGPIGIPQTTVSITLPERRAETLVVGDTVTLTATALDGEGREITAGTVEWRGGSVLLTSPRTALVRVSDTSMGVVAILKRFGYGDVQGQVTIKARRFPGAVLIWTPGVGSVMIPSPEGAHRVDALSINDRGEVAGTVDYGGRTQAFVWSQKLGYLEVPVVFSTYAVAINNMGIVIGDIVLQSGQHTAFVWSLETRAVEIIGAGVSDINEAGQVLGSREGRPFIWSKATGIQELSSTNGWNDIDNAFDINDNGDILLDPNGRYAEGIDYGFAWPANPSIWIAGTRFGFDCDCVLSDMNNGRVIAGNRMSPSSGAFRWSRESGIEMLPAAPGQSTVAYAINESGVVAGALWVKEIFWRPRAAIWRGREITVIPDDSGMRSTVARDVNNVGQVLVVLR